MTNEDVLRTLKSLITRVEERLDELEQRYRKPGGTLAERLQRRDRILERISSLNLRRHHLRRRADARQMSKELGEAVPPLSEERAEILREALGRVSVSLKGLRTFQAFLDLSVEISNAAARADDAAGPA